MKQYLLILLSLFILGCVQLEPIGPVSNGDTARTLGKRNHSVRASLNPLPTTLKQGPNNITYNAIGQLRYDYGVLNNVDIGIQMESPENIGLQLKYAPVNNQKMGWSFGGSLGTGYIKGDPPTGESLFFSLARGYLSGALLASHKMKLKNKKVFEPFGGVRHTEVFSFEDMEDGIVKSVSSILKVFDIFFGRKASRSSDLGWRHDNESVETVEEVGVEKIGLNDVLQVNNELQVSDENETVEETDLSGPYRKGSGATVLKYFQVFVGAKYWWTKHLASTVEVSLVPFSRAKAQCNVISGINRPIFPKAEEKNKVVCPKNLFYKGNSFSSNPMVSIGFEYQL